MKLSKGIETSKHLNAGILVNQGVSAITKKINDTYDNPILELLKIKSSDIEYNDNFGSSIAMYGDRIVVGAPFEDGAGSSNRGAAYVFDLDGNELFKLQASDTEDSDLFGISVAISDTRIVVGANYEDTGGSNAGSAYIFDLNGVEIAKIQGSITNASNEFGRAVACSSDKIVVTSRNDDGAGTNAGAAYIFDINGNQLSRLVASDGAVYDYFGISAAISSNRILIGAYGHDAGGSEAGAAYLFDLNGVEIAKIQASDPTVNAKFGYAVAMSDKLFIVGAFGEVSNGADSGAAYIFDLNGVEIAKIIGSDTSVGDKFGFSVSISENIVAVGANYEGSAGVNAGAAYIFDTKGNELAKIQSKDIQAGDQFGKAVSVHGYNLAIGAVYQGGGNGEAYLFRQKYIPKTTSVTGGLQNNVITYANLIDATYDL